jgi:hypothetical protein
VSRVYRQPTFPHTLDVNERNRLGVESREKGEQGDRQKPGLTIFLGSLKQLPKLLQISIIAPSVVWVAWMIGSRYCFPPAKMYSAWFMECGGWFMECGG